MPRRVVSAFLGKISALHERTLAAAQEKRDASRGLARQLAGVEVQILSWHAAVTRGTGPGIKSAVTRLVNSRETAEAVRQRMIAFLKVARDNFAMEQTPAPWEVPPEIPTASGIRVRSQPERVIADYLFENGIDFDYEVRVDLRNWKGNSTWRLCDFVLNGPGLKVVYWEHFGMWDDAEYRRKARQKMAMYHEAGLNLHCTFGSAPSAARMNRIVRAAGLGR